jgi:hypothetical protein
MLESKYQSQVIAKLRDLFPGCIIMKNDSSYLQGIPDITILFGRHWAVLEIKSFAKARRRPNQAWYNEQMNSMSFAAFLCPENEEEVLDALQRTLRPRRVARVSQS